LLQNILGKKGHTVIFITHRPAVVEYCDQVLEVGKPTPSPSLKGRGGKPTPNPSLKGRGE